MIISSNPANQSGRQDSPQIARRILLKASGATALAATIGGTASCSAAGDSPPVASTTDAALPTYMPYAAVKPDIPAANKNAIDGFLAYPEDPVDAVGGPVGVRDPISILAPLSVITPPAMKKNAFWQNLNESLGVTLDLTMVPASDYPNRFATTIAGGDLADVLRVPSPTPQLAALARSKFADLTEYLSGDAIADYPLLANIPTATWQGALLNGRIMGVPMHLLPLSFRTEARADVIDKLGVSARFSSAAEFIEFCRAVTDPRANRWALLTPYPSYFTRQICGVPNGWTITDGQFTNEVETVEYKRWLGLQATLWSEGLYHPQALTNPQSTTLFQGGQFVLYEVGGPGFAGAIGSFRKANPDFRVTPVVPPSYDGGGPAPVYVSSGNNGMTVINRALSPDRIRGILRVLNALAGPFGTKQYLDVRFGREGVDYTWQSGTGPVLTAVGATEKIVTNYTPGAPMVNYAPGFPDATRTECAYEAQVGESAIPYPLAGLYSAENTSTGAALDAKIRNAALDIVTGRKELNSWDEVVRAWRSSGGNKIRTEFETSYKQNRN